MCDVDEHVAVASAGLHATPLLIALGSGNLACAELLLGAGAELDLLHDNASGKETSPHRLRLPLTPMQLPTPRRSAPVAPYYPS